MAKLKRVYWVRLLQLIKLLCRFYKKWGSKLPTDLPPVVFAFLLTLDAVCMSLETYDNAHPRGGGL